MKAEIDGVFLRGGVLVARERSSRQACMYRGVREVKNATAAHFFPTSDRTRTTFDVLHPSSARISPPIPTQ